MRFIGEKHASAEQEANRAAAQVTRPRVLSAVQEAATTPAPPIVDEALRAAGRPLDLALRRRMEPRFGRDFSNVRVHTDATAEGAARSIGALAFTAGSDVVFGRGQFAPETEPGQRLLAHELAHVAQGGAATIVRRQLAPTSSAARAPLETNIASNPPAAPWFPDALFYELLAHDLAYRTDLDGRYLYRPAPLTQPPYGDFIAYLEAGFERLPTGLALLNAPPSIPLLPGPLYYHLTKHVDPENDLQLYVLVPNRSDAPSIVAFRGTVPTLKNIEADADASGVGRTVFYSSSAQTLLGRVFATIGGGAVVTGHSLGGAYAQLTTIEFSGQISKTITFNSPGISKEDAGLLKPGAKAPEVTHYVTRGDVVSTAGQVFLPGTVNVLSGKATTELQSLVNSDRIDAAQSALDALPAVLGAVIAVETVPKALVVGPVALIEILAAYVAVYYNGLNALKEIGDLAAQLHSGRFLASTPKPTSPPKLPLGGFAGSLLPKAPPKATASTIPSPGTEAGRVRISSSLIAALPVIFDKVIPMIDALRNQTAIELAKELSGIDSPLRKLAVEIAPLVFALVSTVDEAGGLKKIFQDALD